MVSSNRVKSTERTPEIDTSLATVEHSPIILSNAIASVRFKFMRISLTPSYVLLNIFESQIQSKKKYLLDIRYPSIVSPSTYHSIIFEISSVLTTLSLIHSYIFHTLHYSLPLVSLHSLCTFIQCRPYGRAYQNQRLYPSFCLFSELRNGIPLGQM